MSSVRLSLVRSELGRRIGQVRNDGWSYLESRQYSNSDKPSHELFHPVRFAPLLRPDSVESARE